MEIPIAEHIAPSIDTTRMYYCRNCRTTHLGPAVPRGWYRLSRYPGTLERRPVTIAIYCSAACLAASVPHIERGERRYPEGHYDNR